MNTDSGSFSGRFSAWLGNQNPESDRFFHSGLIVFDTNALFALYSVNLSAREQVIGFFDSVKERIWIPHQVGLEFARNRDIVAQSRNKPWGDAKAIAQHAEKEALHSLESAIESVLGLRSKMLSQRLWDLESAQLDHASLKRRLDGVMSPVIEELNELKKEQDKTIKNIQQEDPILAKLEPILSGRIGPAYTSSQLREIVEEAIEFRFPNRIPPGFKDSGKSTPLHAAGDYILWRQLLDKVKGDHLIANVLLVTNDTKPDWCRVDDNGNSTGTHRELIQEMKDVGDADLLVLTLPEFFKQAPDDLSSNVSSDTIDQIITAAPLPAQDNDFYGYNLPGDLPKLSSSQFESAIERLLVRMGFTPQIDSERFDDSGLDFIVIRQSEDSIETYGVEIKNLILLADSRIIIRFSSILRANGIQKGIIFTTSKATSEARMFAKSRGIEVYDGAQTRALFNRYFD